MNLEIWEKCNLCEQTLRVLEEEQKAKSKKWSPFLKYRSAIDWNERDDMAGRTLRSELASMR
eukprot:295996-Hanusia_phi.AAC.2